MSCFLGLAPPPRSDNNIAAWPSFALLHGGLTHVGHPSRHGDFRQGGAQSGFLCARRRAALRQEEGELRRSRHSSSLLCIPATPYRLHSPILPSLPCIHTGIRTER